MTTAYCYKSLCWNIWRILSPLSNTTGSLCTICKQFNPFQLSCSTSDINLSVLAGLTLLEDLCEEIPLGRLTLLSHWSKSEVQVALHLSIEALCHLTIFATCNVLKGNDCVYWYQFDSSCILMGTFIKSNPFRFKGTYYLLNFIWSLIILHIHTFCKQSLDLSIQESCTFLVSWTKQVTLIL